MLPETVKCRINHQTHKTNESRKIVKSYLRIVLRVLFEYSSTRYTSHNHQQF